LHILACIGIACRSFRAVRLIIRPSRWDLDFVSVPYVSTIRPSLRDLYYPIVINWFKENLPCELVFPVEHFRATMSQGRPYWLPWDEVPSGLTVLGSRRAHAGDNTRMFCVDIGEYVQRRIDFFLRDIGSPGMMSHRDDRTGARDQVPSGRPYGRNLSSRVDQVP
jgi:hypothetical protein